VIRIRLKNSSDILLRMVDAATDTHKRCEWVRVYVADCDLNGKAFTVPELTESLGHLSNRIRVIPMADDESGTCIVELPDVILDASVSTQMDNIKEVLAGATLDRDRK
ncbi:MAG: F0F1 ATP synthase subunit delta, partial [Oscillospiraceae bacterium]|nr:F0F1 ATP synthase subunit delta [Oscillospiraceae bacterium]